MGARPLREAVLCPRHVWARPMCDVSLPLSSVILPTTLSGPVLMHWESECPELRLGVQRGRCRTMGKDHSNVRPSTQMMVKASGFLRSRSWAIPGKEGRDGGHREVRGGEEEGRSGGQGEKP